MDTYGTNPHRFGQFPLRLARARGKKVKNAKARFLMDCFMKPCHLRLPAICAGYRVGRTSRSAARLA